MKKTILLAVLRLVILVSPAFAAGNPVTKDMQTVLDAFLRGVSWD